MALYSSKFFDWLRSHLNKESTHAKLFNSILIVALYMEVPPRCRTGISPLYLQIRNNKKINVLETLRGF